MAQRILTLSHYLFRSLLFSLAGLLYILAGLAFWRIFFDPTQSTPEFAYYVLVIGLFGSAVAFLATLSIAARAYHAAAYPLLVRLPSRVEHLTAVLIASTAFTLLLQLLIAVLALWRGPDFSLGHILEIPPIWLSANLLAAILALHASDLVTAGWSRIYVFGTLAVFLFGRQLDSGTSGWLGNGFSQLASAAFRQGWGGLGDLFNRISVWLNGNGANWLGNLFDLLFWPFHAINDGVIRGGFQPVQALAPALLLLYATILFMLAADLFATKDLFLTE